MAKRLMLVMTVTGLLLSLWVGNAVAQDAATDETELPFRTFTAPDLGSFEYPLDTYSVRQGYSNSPLIMFPGVISIEPNDSFLFGSQNPNRGIVYQMQIGSTGNENGYTADTLEDALGQLALLQYDETMLAGLNIQHIEIDGSPAIRVNGLPVGLSGGPVTHIIVLQMPSANPLVEFIISPAATFGAVTLREANQGDERVNVGIMEDIITSFEFLR